jgi:hypothetical protein
VVFFRIDVRSEACENALSSRSSFMPITALTFVVTQVTDKGRDAKTSR